MATVVARSSNVSRGVGLPPATSAEAVRRRFWSRAPTATCAPGTAPPSSKLHRLPSLEVKLGGADCLRRSSAWDRAAFLDASSVTSFSIARSDCSHREARAAAALSSAAVFTAVSCSSAAALIRVLGRSGATAAVPEGRRQRPSSRWQLTSTFAARSSAATARDSLERDAPSSSSMRDLSQVVIPTAAPLRSRASLAQAASRSEHRVLAVSSCCSVRAAPPPSSTAPSPRAAATSRAPPTARRWHRPASRRIRPPAGRGGLRRGRAAGASAGALSSGETGTGPAATPRPRLSRPSENLARSRRLCAAHCAAPPTGWSGAVDLRVQQVERARRGPRASAPRRPTPPTSSSGAPNASTAFDAGDAATASQIERLLLGVIMAAGPAGRRAPAARLGHVDVAAGALAVSLELCCRVLGGTSAAKLSPPEKCTPACRQRRAPGHRSTRPAKRGKPIVRQSAWVTRPVPPIPLSRRSSADAAGARDRQTDRAGARSCRSSMAGLRRSDRRVRLTAVPQTVTTAWSLRELEPLRPRRGHQRTRSSHYSGTQRPQRMPGRRCREWGQVDGARRGGGGGRGHRRERRSPHGSRRPRGSGGGDRAGAHAEPDGMTGSPASPSRGGHGVLERLDEPLTAPPAAPRAALLGRHARDEYGVAVHTRRGWYTTARSSSSPRSTPSPTSPRTRSRRRHLGLHSVSVRRCC